MIELDESCNGREFVLAPGEEIRLKLAENPTTGYRWGFSVEELHPLRLDEDVFEPMGEAMGAVGHRRWRFRADGEGGSRFDWSSGAAGSGRRSKPSTSPSASVNQRKRSRRALADGLARRRTRDQAITRIVQKSAAKLLSSR